MPMARPNVVFILPDDVGVPGSVCDWGRRTTIVAISPAASPGVGPAAPSARPRRTRTWIRPARFGRVVGGWACRGSRRRNRGRRSRHDRWRDAASRVDGRTRCKHDRRSAGSRFPAVWDTRAMTPPQAPASQDVPDRAQVVIIGGGVIGTSVAYHLARLGWNDVV